MSTKTFTFLMLGHTSVGGSAIVCSALGVELAKRGHCVHFMGQTLPPCLQSQHPRIFFHPVPTPKHDFFHFPKHSQYYLDLLVKICLDQPIDIIHIHYAQPFLNLALSVCHMLPKRPKILAPYTALMSLTFHQNRHPNYDFHGNWHKPMVLYASVIGLHSR